MTDQHNANALSCYGNKEIKTPYIDSIAERGVIFNNAICQSGQCRPSRFSLLTGQHARTHGLLWNQIPEQQNQYTLPRLFKKAGYETASIGKHHMNMEQNNNHGFDHVLIDVSKNYSYHGDFIDNKIIHPGKANVGASHFSNEKHIAGKNTRLAIDYIKQLKGNPFFIQLSYHGPHTPICASMPWAEYYTNSNLTLPKNNANLLDSAYPNREKYMTKSGTFNEALHQKTLAYYYGLISQIDYNIGKVLEQLKKCDLFEDTVIIFTSDHGEMMSEHGIWTKGKIAYDALIRVPMIISNPEIKPKHSVSNQLIGLYDLYPTLCSMANINIDHKINGINFESGLTDRNKVLRDFIVTETGPSLTNKCLSIRTKNSKYVEIRKNNDPIYYQYFDLDADPWEIHNLIHHKNYQQNINKLKNNLNVWENDTEIHQTLMN